MLLFIITHQQFLQEGNGTSCKKQDVSGTILHSSTKTILVCQDQSKIVLSIVMLGPKQ